MGVMIKSKLTVFGALLVVFSQCVAEISPKFDNPRDRAKIYSTAESQNVTQNEGKPNNIILAITHKGKLTTILNKLQEKRIKTSNIAMFSSLEVKRWTAVAFTNKLIFMELYTHISNRHTTEAYKRHWDYHRSRLKRKENISWEENQVAEGGYIEWIHIMFMLSKWDEQT